MEMFTSSRQSSKYASHTLFLFFYKNFDSLDRINKGRCALWCSGSMFAKAFLIFSSIVVVLDTKVIF